MGRTEAIPVITGRSGGALEVRGGLDFGSRVHLGFNGFDSHTRTRQARLLVVRFNGLGFRALGFRASSKQPVPIPSECSLMLAAQTS